MLSQNHWLHNNAMVNSICIENSGYQFGRLPEAWKMTIESLKYTCANQILSANFATR